MRPLCQVLRVKQSDGVHPKHGRGPLFYGSLVTHALYRAHEAWAQEAWAKS